MIDFFRRFSQKIWGDIALNKSINNPLVQVAKFFDFSVTPTFKDREFLHQKYVVERLSPREISELISSSRSTVVKYLKKLEIPLRAEEEAKTKSQLGFGEKWGKRQVQSNKREQELILKMQKLRTEGLSYGKIADVLNAWGIPTKTNKGKWSAKQVHQILERVKKQSAGEGEI